MTALLRLRVAGLLLAAVAALSHDASEAHAEELRVATLARQILRETGAKASAALGTRVRAEDDAAYARLAGKMVVIKLEAAEKKRWVDLFAKVRARLAQGTFSPDLVKRVEKLGGK